MGAREWLSNYLDVSTPPEKCDAIFVLAGKHERKIFGIELWRAGYAPELILSVDRFELRRFYSLGLPDGGLRKLAEATPPARRHFFVRFRGIDAESILVKKGRYGTLTEALGAARLLHAAQIRRLMIVSSPIHMRRVSLAFRRALRRGDVQCLFVAPSGRESWSALLTELAKYLCYRLLLWPSELR